MIGPLRKSGASAAGRVSADVPDWGRERCTFGRWEPGKRLVRAIRDYQKWRRRGGVLGRVLGKVAACRHLFWSIVCGSDLPATVEIGGGLVLPHPQGVVMHGEARIGPNCMIFQQVTIGTGPREGVPTLGGHVDVGAGAKVLGGVVVGDHAKIGANAVVLCDVPAGATAVGVPARIIAAKKSNVG
jgi:serine O-acetyltransferase